VGVCVAHTRRHHWRQRKAPPRQRRVHRLQDSSPQPASPRAPGARRVLTAALMHGSGGQQQVRVAVVPRRQPDYTTLSKDNRMWPPPPQSGTRPRHQKKLENAPQTRLNHCSCLPSAWRPLCHVSCLPSCHQHTHTHTPHSQQAERAHGRRRATTTGVCGLAQRAHVTRGVTGQRGIADAVAATASSVRRWWRWQRQPAAARGGQPARDRRASWQCPARALATSRGPQLRRASPAERKRGGGVSDGRGRAKHGRGAGLAPPARGVGRNVKQSAM
jgi:hypothetical protein